MTSNTYAHITTWVIAIILFIVVLALHKAGNQKGSKIVHMVLRLFYLFVIITGGFLFFEYQSGDPALYGIKLLGGLLVIGMMEMVLVRGKKGKSTGLFWLLLIVFLLVTLFLGLKLPMGWHPFA